MLPLQHQFVGDGHPQTLRRPGASASWPGQSRPSTPFWCNLKEDVDARHKAGHDDTIILTDSIYRPDQGLDLVRMRAEFLGKLVEIGIGERSEAPLVDIVDNFDAE